MSSLHSKIVAVIPAREGSKRIPNKNIIQVAGKPLIYYTIRVAKQVKLIEEIYISTDSKKIAYIGKEEGVKAPFLRPKEISQDNSTDLEWVKHFLEYIKPFTPEYIVHLRPTTPIRKAEVIDKAIQIILKNPEATALRSVHKVSESPYKMFYIHKGYLKGLFPDYPVKEYYNLPNQAFPQVYKPNGYVDIIKVDTVLTTNTLHGDKILAFETEPVVEIDTWEELKYVEYLMQIKGVF